MYRVPTANTYIDRKYYDILSCLIYPRNLVIICTADGMIQPMIVSSTTIPWFQPLVVVCQSRFIEDIGIKEKYRIHQVLAQRDFWDLEKIALSEFRTK